jgi:chaperonin cofactor prefoldin
MISSELLNNTQAGSNKQVRDVYVGIPDPGVDLQSAVEALRENVEILVGLRGGSGVAFTVEDYANLRESVLRGGSATGSSSTSTGEVVSLDAVSASVRSLEDQLRQLDQSFTLFKTETNNALSDLDARATDLETVTLDHENRISDTEAAITTLESQVATLQSQVATLQSQVATLQSQVTTLQSQVATLQSQVASLDARVTALENP